LSQDQACSDRTSSVVIDGLEGVIAAVTGLISITRRGDLDPIIADTLATLMPAVVKPWRGSRA
jgi:hypothetical protein